MVLGEVLQMRELMISYHSVKKEVRFFVKVKGEFAEIPYEDCANLKKYRPESGEFVLQNQGTQFLDDIWNQFLNETIQVTFKGTKIDCEDLLKKFSDYNEAKGKEIFTIVDFVELPTVTEIYECIEAFCDETLDTFEKELEENDTKAVFRKRRQAFEDYKESLNSNDVNLCLVGTYSAGKSTFINTLIGKRILPESINSETAKMFKISNGKTPKVQFLLYSGNAEKEQKVQIVWNSALGVFEFKTTNIDTNIRTMIEKEVAAATSMGCKQHEQLYRILKKLNDVPNKTQSDGSAYINGIIEVIFPIPLCKNVNFTFFDTPGTDSNSSEHLLILKKSFQQQSNSILVVIYEPTKMEGTGNSVLYNLINSFKSADATEQNVSIDFARSLHVINQADTRSTNDLKILRNKKVYVTLKEEDKIFNEEDMEIDLSQQRLFFVSSKAAYICQAIKNRIEHEDERIWLTNHKAEINNEPTCDLLTGEAINANSDTGKYYRYDKLANADFETKQLIEENEAAAAACDTSLDGIVDRLYINSGMYAIEEEIKKYAQKYALSVKAKGLYDGISGLVNFIRSDYQAMENQFRLSKDEIERNIHIMKTSMIDDIVAARDAFVAQITDDGLETQVNELKQLVKEIEHYQKLAGSQADKMQWIALRQEVFEAKNRVILSNLNRYLQDIDDYYKTFRGHILRQQVQALKEIIIQKIKEYKGIDENLILRIANISETEIPASELSALKMDDYINEQKAILIFNTMDKKAYKRDLQRAFNNQTLDQFLAYKQEIIKVAQIRTAEMVEEFKNNIETISGSLELLIQNEQKAIEEQNKAKKVLDMIERQDSILNKKIWGEE